MAILAKRFCFIGRNFLWEQKKGFSACGGLLLRQNSLPPHGNPREAFLFHRTQFPMGTKKDRYHPDSPYDICLQRRRRDLNPRAAINDLHPFQGCPFSLLGTSAQVPMPEHQQNYIIVIRRRDLNPRAAINDLHPFQGCPFSLLGTSAQVPMPEHQQNYIIVIGRSKICPTERVGFEPTRPCGQTVFKTASL